MSAARAKRTKVEGGRYRHKDLGHKIDALRRKRGMPAKAFYEEIGWDKGEYSRKTRGLTPLTIEECGRAADILDAGMGFPFVDSDTSEILDALKRGELSQMLDALKRKH